MKSRKSITVIGTIDLSAQTEAVKRFLQDLTHIVSYEPKLIQAVISPSSDTEGTYQTSGCFMGFGWRGTFSYVLNQKGFHSEMIAGPLANKMQGGFVVAENSEKGSQLRHYESYQFSWLSRLVAPMLSFYLKRMMKKELINIASLINSPMCNLSTKIIIS